MEISLMWRETREYDFMLVELRRAELINEAAWYRLARSASPDRSGLRTRVGRVLVDVGSTLSQREAPCNDPCPECA
jgi:hypothetical protein